MNHHRVAQTLASIAADNVGKCWHPQSPGHSVKLGQDAASWYLAQSNSDSLPVRSTYAELARYIDAQYSMIAMVFEVTVSEGDPYGSADELFVDLDQGILKTFKSPDSCHPLWTPEQNDRFRAVHDVFGHYASRVTFHRDGEDAAYRSHARTFPDYVLPALATETRAQNSALVYGPNPGQFADQLAVLCPLWIWQPGT